MCVCVCVCAVPSVMVTVCDPMDCSPPGSSVHGFSRQEYWGGLLCPPPGDLSHPGIETAYPVAPALQENFLALSNQGNPSRVLL